MMELSDQCMLFTLITSPWSGNNQKCSEDTNLELKPASKADSKLYMIPVS